MHPLFKIALFTIALQAVGPAAFAQSTDSLEKGGFMAWASLGFQGDLGGSVNVSGIGVVNGQRAEINTNTWSERYDAALIFRFGGAFNITSNSQIFGALSMEQSEADTAVVGLIGGQDLTAKFSDYQGWGIDAGYRYFFRTQYKMMPFVSGSLGFQRVQNITLDLSSPAFTRNEIPFYDDSWVVAWRAGTGFLYDINDRVGWQVTLDLKYSGVLSDEAGIGTIGFERINEVGNRWTVPIMGGVYVKF
jgi:hypothetical protein